MLPPSCCDCFPLPEVIAVMFPKSFRLCLFLRFCALASRRASSSISSTISSSFWDEAPSWLSFRFNFVCEDELMEVDESDRFFMAGSTFLLFERVPSLESEKDRARRRGQSLELLRTSSELRLLLRVSTISTRLPLNLCLPEPAAVVTVEVADKWSVVLTASFAESLFVTATLCR